ncbi:MAG: Stp1/IreP family PP2C-type Ser/Thr phosphatase [Lachnospira sp.]
MKSVAMTDIGMTRAVNQDYVYASENAVGCLPNLFVLADGMGGHKAGDMASRYTVEQFVSLIGQSGAKDPISAISQNVTKVNLKLMEKAEESPDYEGMGTTLVVASIFDNVLRVANVGDSRLYVINDDIVQITRDHSLVEEMVLMGKIGKEEAKNHSQKNVITRAIGGYIYVEAEMFSVDLKENDRILMCSDGLTNMVEDSEILNIIKSNSNIEEAASQLIAKANENGGSDNISVIIIEP